MVAAILGLLAWVFFRGKVAFALGVYLATLPWSSNVDIRNIHLQRILAVFLAGTVLIYALRRGRDIGQALTHPLVRNCFLLVTLWVIWIGIKVLQGVGTTPGTMFFFFLTNNIFPVVVMLLAVEKIDDFRQAAWGYLVAEVPAALGSLFIYRTGAWGESGIVMGLGGENYLRFSYGLAIGILLGVGLVLTSRKLLRNLLLLAMIGACAYSLVLTTARQTAVGTAVALGFFALAEGRRRGRIITMMAAAAVLAGVVYITTSLAPGASNFVTARWSTTHEAAQIREEYWDAGWEVFLQHPNTGAGLIYMVNTTNTAHNLYIDVLAAQGLVGGLFFLGFAGFIVAGLRARGSPATATPEGRTWKAAIVSIMIFTATHSFASGSVVGEPDFFWAPFLLLILVTMGPEEPVVDTRTGGEHEIGPERALGLEAIQ